MLTGDGEEGGVTSAEAQLSWGQTAALQQRQCSVVMVHNTPAPGEPLAGEQARAEWAENSQGQGWWLLAQVAHL